GHIANLIRVVVTARFLRPEDFGLFSIAMLVYGAAIVFAELGLRPAFIAHAFVDEREKDEWIDTIWTAELLIKGALGLVLALVAYPAALYFREPEVAWMIVVIGFAPMLRSLQNPNVTLLEKQIDFRPLAISEMTGTIGSAVITAACAIVLRSAWALTLSAV